MRLHTLIFLKPLIFFTGEFTAKTGIVNGNAVGRCFVEEQLIMSFTFEKTNIPGVVIIQPKVFGDNRGYFMETYKKEDFVSAGIIREVVQDNESSSTKGVLRGLHFQKNHTQGKLVRVTHGEVYDVAVDVRPGSETYGQWVGVVLSSKKRICFIFRKDLPMDFLYYLILQNLYINVPMYMIQHLKAVSRGMIQI